MSKEDNESRTNTIRRFSSRNRSSARSSSAFDGQKTSSRQKIGGQMGEARPRKGGDGGTKKAGSELERESDFSPSSVSPWVWFASRRKKQERRLVPTASTLRRRARAKEHEPHERLELDRMLPVVLKGGLSTEREHLSAHREHQIAAGPPPGRRPRKATRRRARSCSFAGKKKKKPTDAPQP